MALRDESVGACATCRRELRLSKGTRLARAASLLEARPGQQRCRKCRPQWPRLNRMVAYTTPREPDRLKGPWRARYESAADSTNLGWRSAARLLCRQRDTP